jgi:hypothetical protein
MQATFEQFAYLLAMAEPILTQLDDSHRALEAKRPCSGYPQARPLSTAFFLSPSRTVSEHGSEGCVVMRATLSFVASSGPGGRHAYHRMFSDPYPLGQPM